MIEPGMKRCVNGDCAADLPDHRLICLRCGTQQPEPTALPPIARGDDAATSHEAAANVTASGKRMSIMSEVRGLLAAAGPHTSGEIADLLGRQHQQVWRRVSDLKNRGEIYPEGTREWRGNRQQVWWLVRTEPEQRSFL